ncbi:PREDICTED: poly(rC)-binding protein 2-like [Amphimedon queenslandica]|uniref:K Homology domain-containing protein n=1 Tax=Amphimedon queenslandica TaxID=400682 RepID=A0A1X7U403_AMPQE|nr:PREDICTED: poly(rC)-binding protein 2-like [Amphimedon queenslandica]|eukprot:XP_011406106.1 PREDICTED: poly(rC)-binding protein 2-like [Amphimedon queenslandica]
MASTSRGSEVDDTCSEKAEETKSSSTSTASLKVQTSGECEQSVTATSKDIPPLRGEPAPDIDTSTERERGEREREGEGAIAAAATSMDKLVVSIRMIMNSKDVGSIIGKAGMTIKSFREKSGAKINISNGTSSERLVTVSGTKAEVCVAFTAISRKIEEDNQSLGSHARGVGTDPDQSLGGVVSIRLIIQTSQCGSLIGKGGSRIKEIREVTGAIIQVSGESLPNSTERAVTISGSSQSISRCLDYICDVILENPPKGPSVPYKPHSNQSYQQRPGIPFQQPYPAGFNTTPQIPTTVQQMRIPNDLIGCVIGRKGTKIHEIRVNSGALIKIASNEGDGSDRLVTISGTPESVGIAQYLINSRIHSEVNSYLSVGTLTSV